MTQSEIEMKMAFNVMPIMPKSFITMPPSEPEPDLTKIIAKILDDHQARLESMGWKLHDIPKMRNRIQKDVFQHAYLKFIEERNLSQNNRIPIQLASSWVGHYKRFVEYVFDQITPCYPASLHQIIHDMEIDIIVDITEIYDDISHIEYKMSTLHLHIGD